MELITFRCPACRTVLKVRPDKAGRKAKCKCGAQLTIPMVSEELTEADSAPAAPPKPAPAPVADEEDATAYGMEDLIAPTPEVEVEHKETKEEDVAAIATFQAKEAEARRKRRAAMRRASMDPVKWEKIRVGILLVLIATCFWIGAIALHRLIIVIGLFSGPEYASVADLGLDKASFVIGISAGSSLVDVGVWLARIAQIFILLAGLIGVAGYAVCLAVPPRYGTHGLAISVLALGGINLVLQLVFKLLPLTGVIPYTMVPLVAPEIAMLVANTERLEPLHVFWSHAPFWEMFAALIIQMLFYAEPVLFALFLRAVALSVKDHWLQTTADAFILLVLGTAFGLLAYYLLSVTGTSEVLGWVLRVIYSLWTAFLVGQVLWYAVILHRSRNMIEAKLAEEEA
jgi:hypothetical protein